MTIILGVVLGLLLIFGVWFALTYNALVRLRLRVDNAWAQISVALQKRHDLIPNLVQTVQGYAGHEKTVFEEVTQARAAAAGAKGPAESAAAETTLTGALGRLFAVSENYPQLQASEQFQNLQHELSAQENNIALNRQIFNDVVQTYNQKGQTFPTNLIAARAGYVKREFFDVSDESVNSVPQVSFQ